jgi:Domain of unknown function (DUF4173)
MHVRPYSSFLLKGGGALALVILADRLFWASGGIGSNLGIFAASLVAVVVAVSPSVRRNRLAVAAAALAALLCLALGDDPGLLAWTLFWTLLSVAVLLPRAAGFGSAVDWLIRLLAQSVVGIIGPWRDLARLRRTRPARRSTGLRGLLPLLPLPLVGGSIFLALFAAANPVIGDAFARLQLPEFQALRWIFWGIVATLVWTVLRPRKLRWWGRASSQTDSVVSLPGVSVGSVTLSLLAFNALFALQNGLDLAFLWSGAGLPDGMTLADYAHRGAYPLIATALLAGVFVLVTLRPGSDTAAVPLIRRLVVLWVGQNVFLVASSILRTLDYIDAYSLTRLRVAALLWMALVAVGLSLILWRMLAAKSATWLINANALAGGLVLIACSFVDLGSVAASWNVRHAREVGGRGAMLDLCYLGQLGPSALVSLVELESQPLADRDFADRVASVRATILDDVARSQTHGFWTWRNARRLDQVRDLAAQMPHSLVRPAASEFGRNCDGSFYLPPVVEPAAVEPEAVESDPAATLTQGNT